MTTVQQCVSQYRNINFSTKIKFRYRKIKKEKLKKSVGTLYMIIAMYLNICLFKQTLYISLL